MHQTMIDTVLVMLGVGFALIWSFLGLRKLLVGRTANGVSVSMLVFTMGANFLWIFIGVQSGAVLLVLSGASYAVGAAVALFLTTRYGSRFPYLSALIVVLTVTAAITMSYHTTAGLFVVACVALTFAAARFVTQTVVAVRTEGLAGVSAVAWLATATEGALWVVYSVLVGLWQGVVWGVMALIAGVLIGGKAVLSKATARGTTH